MNHNRSSVYKTPKTTQLYVHLNFILGMVKQNGRPALYYKFCMYQADILYVSSELGSSAG